MRSYPEIVTPSSGSAVIVIPMSKLKQEQVPIVYGTYLTVCRKVNHDNV